MRLTCPNCGAQYEVPDEVIPEAGRDVQCSNCGDTWFQAHRDHPRAEEAASAEQEREEVAAPEPEDPTGAAEPEPDIASDTEPAQPAAGPTPDHEPAPPASGPGPSDVGEDDSTTDKTADAPPPDTPERREIDPAVASVLREEAEREQRARAAARSGLETQPDLGLTDAAEDERPRRPRRVPRPSQDEAEAQDSDPAARSGLFPDIEEINSSLVPGGDAATADDPHGADARRSGGGFRGGFLTAVLIAVLALLVYIFAPQLAETVPGVGDLLTGYVAWVDGLRLWLDRQIADLMLWLDGMASVPPAPSGDGTGN